MLLLFLEDHKVIPFPTLLNRIADCVDLEPPVEMLVKSFATYKMKPRRAPPPDQSYCRIFSKWLQFCDVQIFVIAASFSGSHLYQVSAAPECTEGLCIKKGRATYPRLMLCSHAATALVRTVYDVYIFNLSQNLMMGGVFSGYMLRVSAPTHLWHCRCKI